MKTYYDILEIAPIATDKDIKKAYRILAKKYHPDTSDEENCENIFKSIKEAYEFLSDKEARKLYDDYLEKNFTENKTIKESNIPSDLFQEHDFIRLNLLQIFGNKYSYEYQIIRGIANNILLNIKLNEIQIFSIQSLIFKKKRLILKIEDIEKIDLGETSGIFRNEKQLIFSTKDKIVGFSTRNKDKYEKLCKTLSFYLPWFKIENE